MIIDINTKCNNNNNNLDEYTIFYMVEILLVTDNTHIFIIII